MWAVTGSKSMRIGVVVVVVVVVCGGVLELLLLFTFSVSFVDTIGGCGMVSKPDTVGSCLDEEERVLGRVGGL